MSERRTRLARVLDRDDVWRLCIKHQYYTRGDCESYEKMLSSLDHRSKYTGSNINAYSLEDLATDIKNHSDTEDTVEVIMENLCALIRVEIFHKAILPELFETEEALLQD